MASVYLVSYNVGGGRRKHVGLSAENEDDARRKVCEMETRDQVDNNLFLNVDGISVVKM